MKDKAFIIDFNLLAEQNLSIDEYIVLLYLSDNILYNNSKIILESLQEKQFIKIITNEKILIREKGKIFLELITIDCINSTNNKKITKKSSRVLNQDLDTFVKEFRNLWKGLKPGSMGSESACRDKLFRWMQNNPLYTKEDILKAAKIYINNLDNYNYLQQADYFIYKKDLNGESSRLSAFIDEIDNKIEDNWVNKLI
jgi:hypothetical protein